jgi:aconitate hydratase
LKFDPKAHRKSIQTSIGTSTIYHLPSLDRHGLGDVSRLPYSIRVLLESALRNNDGFRVTDDDVEKLLTWSPETAGSTEIAFKPARVILQDFTGVPAIVDLAALRSAMQRMGKDYRKINPQVPCDLVIDHSVQVDYFGTDDASAKNVEREFERNLERYQFLKWGQRAFDNFRVVPPATGIVHQVNLEYLARGVFRSERDGEFEAYPDSLVGTDSHTTMINGLGILGWGVGGIEAEAVMLGEPIYMVMPHVVGFKLLGELREGITATDLVLTVTEILRAKGVVGKFVEYFGPGFASMSLPDRATLANMAPEYGATMGYSPVDEETLRYYQLSGRDEAQVELIGTYIKEQGLSISPGAPEPTYSDVVELDLADVEPCLAGPRRPQDRIPMRELRNKFDALLTKSVSDGGFGLSARDKSKNVAIAGDGEISHGAAVIAAITSCTNTSNPSVLIAAGLLAKNAVEKGLQVKDHVKTSLAPGSPVVTEYLEASGLQRYLDQLGFNTVGYGCTTCIGNSGPLPEPVANAIGEGDLVAASVLSGNRNFEGRVHALVRGNFLASPPLVVAYALAGSVAIDLTSEPLGKDKVGKDVFLADIWPPNEEVQGIIAEVIRAEVFERRYQDVFKGSGEWNDIAVTGSDLYEWSDKSTYIQEPAFFKNVGDEPSATAPIVGARVLALLGDSVTTDHISPAGAIAQDSPAGRYLVDRGVEPRDFNSYGSRRGNHEVMMRGTFGNIRLRNRLVPGAEGSWTVFFPDHKETTIYDASLDYQKAGGTPLIVLAGKEYGTGSSRDWAAKGTALLGVRAVIARSYERIHRSNLVGMGVLPLQFKEGDSADSLGLKGDETFDIGGLRGDLEPGQTIPITATSPDGVKTEFEATLRIDTPVEVEYYRNGGILQTVLRRLASS